VIVRFGKGIGPNLPDDAYRAQYIALLRQAIDDFGLNLFSALCRKDLRRLLGSETIVDMLEAQWVIGNFGDAADYKNLSVAVARLLKARGVRKPRGKRTARPELVAMTEGVAQVFMIHGIPVTTGDNARIVLALRRIAAELGIAGDPRDVLRSMARLERRLESATYRAVMEAFVRGLAPDSEQKRPLPTPKQTSNNAP
jgi:hypothetical protein